MPYSQPPKGSSFAGGENIETFNQVEQVAEEIGFTVEGKEAKPAEAPAQKPEEEDTISEEDKRNYLRSLLGKERFVKEYTLFGGAVKVEFTTRTVLERNKLKEMGDVIRQLHKLSYSLNSITLGDRCTRNPDIDLIQDLDDIVYASILKVFNEFESLCEELFRRASSPDFWTLTDGAT